MERCGTQGIQFVVQIVLARLLLPEDFGVVAIVTVFISLANVLSTVDLIPHSFRKRMRMMQISPQYFILVYL